MNVFIYANTVELNWKENLADMGNFQPKYTFYHDFAIAEFCEVYAGDRGAVKDTFNRVIKYWGSSYKALTEIVMVLNHKSWAFAQNVDSDYLHCSEEWRNKFTEQYTDLYNKAVEKFFKLYRKDEEALAYYYEVTD